MSSRIIMQLYEDSLTFKNFLSWYIIQTEIKSKENKMMLQAKHIFISPSLYLKTKSSIKLLIVFNALYMKVFIIPILDAHHIRTKFTTKANYHAVLKDSQNNISEA